MTEALEREKIKGGTVFYKEHQGAYEFGERGFICERCPRGGRLFVLFATDVVGAHYGGSHTAREVRKSCGGEGSLVGRNRKT